MTNPSHASIAFVFVVVASACSASSSGSGSSSAGSGGSTAHAGGSGQGGDDLMLPPCGPSDCSADESAVIDCEGRVVESCEGTEGCDASTLTCADGCTIAAQHKRSIGCEYYPTMMLNTIVDSCFAAFVVNLWHAPAHIEVQFGAQPIDLAAHARVPVGSGPALQYQPYDPVAGIAPGGMVILFLAGGGGTSLADPCPVPSAFPAPGPGFPMLPGQGVRDTFRLESDVPIVAYQMNPFGGSGSQVAGASLLLPASAWDDNYILANAYGPRESGTGKPALNVVAAEDDTLVTIVPVIDLAGSLSLPGALAGQPLSFTLQRGEQAQFAQDGDLTGSVLKADKPVGVLAGHACAFVPLGVGTCDHLEESVPPVRALGREYVHVMPRPRADEPAVIRLVGAVDGTVLSWSSDVGGPATLDQGSVIEIATAEPFVVSSQDDDHPFLLLSYMVGNYAAKGVGDPEVSLGVPPEQFLSRYVLFADPTYPETNLVVVRARDEATQAFADVELDCAGVIGGWQPLGEYEWTRVDLVTGGQSVGGCSTGRREVKSSAKFGLWVWGWDAQYTSYGYPAGMNVEPISEVVVPVPE